MMWFLSDFAIDLEERGCAPRSVFHDKRKSGCPDLAFKIEGNPDVQSCLPKQKETQLSRFVSQNRRKPGVRSCLPKQQKGAARVSCVSRGFRLFGELGVSRNQTSFLFVFSFSKRWKGVEIRNRFVRVARESRRHDTRGIADPTNKCHLTCLPIMIRAMKYLATKIYVVCNSVSLARQLPPL